MSVMDANPVAAAGTDERQTSPWPVLSTRGAALVVAVWTLALIAIDLLAHRTPLYFVETDLVGEYLPAARELLAGVLDPSHYAFKGPGYPTLLALFAAPFHGDVELAARIVSPLAAGVAAWFAFALVRAGAGSAIATFALALLLVTPAHVRHAIEAGTDAPALALMLAATWLVVREGGPRSRALAGALAGLAILTRSNAVFLVPCAIALLVSGRDRVRMLAAYAAGAALPLAVWAWVAARAGGVPADRNYLNVAWELYGRGVPWDRFEETIGTRFHSLAGVLAYDPWRAAFRTMSNLVAHRWLDARDLTTPWVGALAAPGLFLLARSRAARPLLLHALACAVVLAPVFYNSRFALYLLPAWLAGAGAALAWLVVRARGIGRLDTWARIAGSAAAAALVLVSAAFSSTETSRHLADAPHEARLAGRELATLAAPGERVMARKPHVAWYAGTKYVPIPSDVAIAGLPAWAVEAGTPWLFFSGIEKLQRPQLGVLADSGLALPGIRQVAWRSLARDHFFALYRLSPTTVDSAGFARAYREALERHEAREPDSPEALLFVAAQYVDLGDPGAALQRLDRLEKSGADDPAVERYRTVALVMLGDVEAAAGACERAMKLERPTGWHWARLGDIRARQNRFREARDCFQVAVELEPATIEYLKELGELEVRIGAYAEAGTTFERWLRLAPGDVTARRYAMGAWQLAGKTERMDRVYRDGLAAGIPSQVLLVGTAESR